MRIYKLSITNFMGYEGKHEFELPQIAALIGKNGIGKTSLLNALRYVITGEKPEGELIHQKCDEARVSIVLEDGNEYEREERRTKPNRCKINGKVTTATSFNEALQTIFKIPLDALKIVSSAEVVAGLKPQELTEFILKYIPEELDADKVIGYIPNSTIGMMEILESTLPAFEKFGIAALDEAEELYRMNRKDLKSKITQNEAYLKTLPTMEPDRPREEVEKEFSEISAEKEAYKIYEVKKDAYTKAKASYDKQYALYQQMLAQVNEIKATKRLPSERAEMVEKKKLISQSLDNSRVVFSTMKSAYTALEQSIEELEKPICPISNKLVCKTDKSFVRKELHENLEELKEGLILQKNEIEKFKQQLEDISEKIDNFDKERLEYEKKCNLSAQMDRIKKAIPEIPDEPEVVEPYSEERADALTKELLAIAKWDERIKLEAQIANLKIQFMDYDSLVKAFEAKGIVRNSIVEYYLGFFEKSINEKAAKLRPGLSYTFENDNGIKILCDTGRGVKLPYESLSGGEKAYMIFIIMDMLNQLSGAKIMMLDELSVMDDETFKMLMSILNSQKETYDHIIIAAVDHEDSIRAIKDEKIPVLNVA